MTVSPTPQRARLSVLRDRQARTARPTPRSSGENAGGMMMELCWAARAGWRGRGDRRAVQPLIADRDGRVVGVVAAVGGEELCTRARRGVILTRADTSTTEDARALCAVTRRVRFRLGCDGDDRARTGWAWAWAATRSAWRRRCIVVPFSAQPAVREGVLVNGRAKRSAPRTSPVRCSAEIGCGARRAGSATARRPALFEKGPSSRPEILAVWPGRSREPRRRRRFFPRGSLVKPSRVQRRRGRAATTRCSSMEARWLQPLATPPLRAARPLPREVPVLVRVHAGRPAHAPTGRCSTRGRDRAGPVRRRPQRIGDACARLQQRTLARRRDLLGPGSRAPRRKHTDNFSVRRSRPGHDPQSRSSFLRPPSSCPSAAARTRDLLGAAAVRTERSSRRRSRRVRIPCLGATPATCAPRWLLPRAALLEAMHPVVGAARRFLALHGRSRGRGYRNARVVITATYGERPRSPRRRLRALHPEVQRTDAQGRRYTALDPRRTPGCGRRSIRRSRTPGSTPRPRRRRARATVCGMASVGADARIREEQHAHPTCPRSTRSPATSWSTARADAVQRGSPRGSCAVGERCRRRRGGSCPRSRGRSAGAPIGRPPVHRHARNPAARGARILGVH